MAWSPILRTSRVSHPGQGSFPGLPERFLGLLVFGAIAVTAYRLFLTIALSDAAREGDSGAVGALLRRGALPNGFRIGPFSRLPLFDALGAQDTKSVAMLLHAGANVNRCDGEGYTLLGLAVLSGTDIDPAKTQGMVELLVRSGANPKARSAPFGLTPVEWTRRLRDRQLLRLLLSRAR